MHKVISIFIGLLFAFPISAEFSLQAPLVKESLLLDIVSEEYTVVVGERGHVLIGSHQGQFSQANVPTQATLTSVATVGDHIWAVGHDAVILYSHNRGKDWQLQMESPDLEKPFLDVFFFDENNGLAIGAYGLFYRTTDGGESWLKEQHTELLDPYDREYLEEIKNEDEEFYIEELNSILPHLNHISYSTATNTLLLAGEAGLLAQSVDYGKSWKRLPVNYTGSFFAINAIDETTIVAAGLRGNIFVSKNGQEWRYLQTCSAATVNAIWVDSKQTLHFLSNNGVIISARPPFSLSRYDPYASPNQCEPAEGISIHNTKSKAALLNAALIGNQPHVAAADGIYILPVE